MVHCPTCGEEEALRGERVGEGLQVHCDTCGTEWTRFPGASCDRCGSTDIWVGLRALVERSRGTQLSIVGTVEVTMCWHCDREVLEDHARRMNNKMLMPTTLPNASGEAPASEHGERS